MSGSFWGLKLHSTFSAWENMPPKKVAPKKMQASAESPSAFFQTLQHSVQCASRDDPFGLRLVDRSKKSLFFSQMNIPRAKRPAYIITKRFFCCFLDIPLSNALYILGVSERVMRKLRTWCGVTRWPRNDIVQHKVVMRERLKLMEEICESDQYGYEMLFQVHETAGYDMSLMPRPRDFEVEPDIHSGQIEAVKAVLEAPSPNYKAICQDFSTVSKVKLPTLEEKMVHVENFIHNKFLPSVNKHLYQQQQQQKNKHEPVQCALNQSSAGAPVQCYDKGQEVEPVQCYDEGHEDEPVQSSEEEPVQDFEWDQELQECLDAWEDLDGVDYSILMQ